MEFFLNIHDVAGNLHIVNLSQIVHVEPFTYAAGMNGSRIHTSVGTAFAIADPPATFATSTTNAVGAGNVGFKAY